MQRREKIVPQGKRSAHGRSHPPFVAVRRAGKEENCGGPQSPRDLQRASAEKPCEEAQFMHIHVFWRNHPNKHQVITSSIQIPHGRYTRTTLQLNQEPLRGSSYADIAKRTVGNPWIPQCPSRGRSHHDANSNEGTSTSNEPWDCESRNRRKCRVETLQRSTARRGEKGQAIRISNEART